MTFRFFLIWSKESILMVILTDFGRAGANAAREPSSIQFRIIIVTTNNKYRKCTQVFQDGQGKNTSTCCKHGQQGL